MKRIDNFVGRVFLAVGTATLVMGGIQNDEGTLIGALIIFLGAYFLGKQDS